MDHIAILKSINCATWYNMLSQFIKVFQLPPVRKTKFTFIRTVLILNFKECPRKPVEDKVKTDNSDARQYIKPFQNLEYLYHLPSVVSLLMWLEQANLDVLHVSFSKPETSLVARCCTFSNT